MRSAAQRRYFPLRPFPGRRGTPSRPTCAVPGEHGFRFFPAYYLHIWDLLQRIPIYQRQGAGWQRTPRTVMDNVQRVVTQATTLQGKPSLVFPREAPRSLAELLTMADQLGEFGGTPTDGMNFAAQIVRYLATSPLRRASELQNLSLFDFFIGRDATAPRRFTYSPPIESLLLDMPKVLAAFDSRWGDARTNISTYLQLVLRTERADDKADGVLNGPTTEAWFDNWYHHLVGLGVRFARARVDHLEPPPADRRVPPHLRPRVRVVLSDGTRHTADYIVCAVDAPTAEHLTTHLRDGGTGGTVAELDGFATSAPPPTGPLQPQATRSGDRRDPYAVAEVGRMKWDRFQTLAGIQFYFDTEFQLVRGHIYYSGSEWGLSSINQQGMWENRPVLGRDGYVSRLSVDIGDFNTPSSRLVDGEGRSKAARDCTPDELAAEVWRQIVGALTSAVDIPPEAMLPWPAWYSLDRNLVFAAGGGGPVRNAAPYLVPIVGDWPNRPGPDPWNPNMSSWTTRPSEADWLRDLTEHDVWQARHGGYQVHHNSLVFAGTWTKTFTRLTTMEAACESARHAVNAILDHFVWASTGGADRREGMTLDWRVPFGFLDQGLSVPVRQPSPAGDYCFVFDLENREPFDMRRLRNLDSGYARAGYPHPLDMLGLTSPIPPLPSGGPPMTFPSTDYAGQLLTYLQAWRQYLEMATGTGGPTASATTAPAWAPVTSPTAGPPPPVLPMPPLVWPVPGIAAYPVPTPPASGQATAPHGPLSAAPPGPPTPPVAAPDAVPAPDPYPRATEAPDAAAVIPAPAPTGPGTAFSWAVDTGSADPPSAGPSLYSIHERPPDQPGAATVVPTAPAHIHAPVDVATVSTDTTPPFGVRPPGQPVPGIHETLAPRWPEVSSMFHPMFWPPGALGQPSVFPGGLGWMFGNPAVAGGGGPRMSAAAAGAAQQVVAPARPNLARLRTGATRPPGAVEILGGDPQA